jgi:hypothetical protein
MRQVRPSFARFLDLADGGTLTVGCYGCAHVWGTEDQASLAAEARAHLAENRHLRPFISQNLTDVSSLSLIEQTRHC